MAFSGSSLFGLLTAIPLAWAIISSAAPDYTSAHRPEAARLAERPFPRSRYLEVVIEPDCNLQIRGMTSTGCQLAQILDSLLDVFVPHTAAREANEVP